MIEEVISLLKEMQITLGACESLTGGLFASTLCSYSGVSKFFKGSIVSYSSLVKRDLVQIDQGLIDEYGVVSSQIAEKMAQNASKLLNVDMCISFTGNAGPTAMEGKKVGLVYIGIYFKGKVSTYEYEFEGDRNSIRNQVVDEGFKIIKNILGN